MEEDGISIGHLEETLKKTVGKERPVKYIYLVPDYSNPSGARLSAEKRRKILDLAGKYNFYILEDTPYSELNYYEERLNFIKEYDQENRVILLGSFSKFFVPGLRVAWVCAPRSFIELLGRAKQDADLASSTIGQLIITRAGEKGLVEPRPAGYKVLPCGWKPWARHWTSISRRRPPGLRRGAASFSGSNSRPV